MLAYAFVGVAAALLVILLLNRGRLAELGFAGTLRLGLIWAAIVMALFIIVRLFGY